MNDHDVKTLLDNLETARIYAGAELGRLCNNNQYIDACVFQSIRDSIAQNIQLLQSYVICEVEMDRKEMMDEIAKMECKIKNLKEELNKQEESKKGRWKPELEERYYSIDIDGEIFCFRWSNDNIDEHRYELGNVFKTEEEAKFAIEQLKVLAELKEYADDDKEWNKGNMHWCIEYDTSDRRMYVNGYNYTIKVPFKIYFFSKEQAQKAIDAIGEERLKKYYFCVKER